MRTGTGRTASALQTKWFDEKEVKRDDAPDWTPEEDKELRAAVEREGIGKWHQKSEAFTSSRSAGALRHRWNTISLENKKPQLATISAKPSGVDDWDLKAELLGTGRTAKALERKWEDSRAAEDQPSYRRNPWSLNEDDLLRKALKKHNPETGSWNGVAAMVPGRSASQCRNRWRNYVDPSISHEPWSEEENALLLRRYQDHDGRWCEIAAAFPGRPDEA